MIRTTKKLVPVAIIFMLVATVFLLCAMFAPLSYDGTILTPDDVGYYISKLVLYLLSLIYYILFGIIILFLINRKLYIDKDTIVYVNWFRLRRVIPANECLFKMRRSRIDLYHRINMKKFCSISMLNDGDIFELIKNAHKLGALDNWSSTYKKQ